MILIKKQKKFSVDDKLTKANNHKILLEKDGKRKIVFYAHQGKSTVILWNNLLKKSVNIKNEAEAKELIKTAI